MINAVIYGYGNIGRATREAIEAAADFRLAGVVSSSLQPGALGDTPVVRDIAQLPKPDVVILCAPSEKTPDLAERLLLAGYRTVDSFDMHQHIPAVCERLDKAAKAGHTAAVISAVRRSNTSSGTGTPKAFCRRLALRAFARQAAEGHR